VNLINKENVFIGESSKNRCEIARSLNCWTRGALKSTAKLSRDYSSERGLSKAGRTMKQHVIERFTTTFTGAASYLEIVSYVFLTNVVIESTGSQRNNEGFLIFKGTALRNARCRLVRCRSVRNTPPRLKLVVQLFACFYRISTVHI
jgi:hypothetical protein